MNKQAVVFSLILLLIISIAGCRVAEQPDDVISTPDGPICRANLEQEGVENPWPPIEIWEEVHRDATIRYRYAPEVKAGESSNNIVYVEIPGKDINNIKLGTAYLPSKIEVKHGEQWRGSGTIAQVLIIEASPDIRPGGYPSEISLEIDGVDYGMLAHTIVVIESE
jgi:hypothetical protein